MKPGYLYVLGHPSDPMLVKVGRTVQKLERRIAQHNSDYTRVAGKIVKETGQKWELKECIETPDPVHAERVFWEATLFGLGPFRGRVEVVQMDWKRVQLGLDAARGAGVRSPKPVPDGVYVYSSWMRKRLVGRGIKLVGQVRSKHGRSDFRCTNGHEWRTVPADVAEGEGCPHCGVGQKDAEEIEQDAGSGFLCLMTHPDKPGLVKVELFPAASPRGWRSFVDRAYEADDWGGWQIHQYRTVQEPALAESLLWRLLGRSRPNAREPIEIDLEIAEQAIRDLISEMYHEIAVMERKKEDLQSTSSA